MSYNYPTEAAWSLLKQEEGEQPELSRDDQMAISAFYEQLDPDSKRRIEVIQHAMSQLSPEKHASLTRGMHDELAPHIGNLSQILPQAHGQSISDNSKTFDKGDKSLAMVYEGRIAKLLPFAIIGAMFAIDAIARSQGARSSPIVNVLKEGYNTIAPEEKEWPIDWGYDNEARIIDPVVGMEHDTVFGYDTNWEDPTMGQRALAGGVGALSYFNPLTVAGKIARVPGTAYRGARGTRAATLTARGEQKANKVLAEKGLAAGSKSLNIYRGNYQTGQRLAEKTNLANAYHAQREAAGKGFGRGLGWGAAGRGMQLGGPVVGALIAANMNDNLPDASNSTVPHINQQGGHSAFGGGLQGQGTNIHGNQTARQEIWNPTGSQFAQQQEWGGMAQKGEYMRLGDKILKEVTDKMHECNKGDKDSKGDKKKPAHGVVIVIGSKAGPGPSTDGKRDKLDSDKSE
jgi:hypothetical protein